MNGLINTINDIFKKGMQSVRQIIQKYLPTSDNKNEQLTANQVAMKNALQQCRKEVKRCKRWKAMPSPKYFEHVAMLSRQAKNYQHEVKVCQLYISLVDEYVAKRKFSKKKIEKKARTLCKPLTARILNAKNLEKNNGVEVNYL